MTTMTRLHALVSRLTAAECDSAHDTMTRRILRDERMRLQGAIQSRADRSRLIEIAADAEHVANQYDDVGREFSALARDQRATDEAYEREQDRRYAESYERRTGQRIPTGRIV